MTELNQQLKFKNIPQIPLETHFVQDRIASQYMKDLGILDPRRPTKIVYLIDNIKLGNNLFHAHVITAIPNGPNNFFIRMNDNEVGLPIADEARGHYRYTFAHNSHLGMFRLVECSDDQKILHKNQDGPNKLLEFCLLDFAETIHDSERNVRGGYAIKARGEPNEIAQKLFEFKNSKIKK